MKKLFAYLLSWFLYYCGDVVSRVMNLIPDMIEENKWYWLIDKIYCAYSFLMQSSLKVQDWADNETPWGRVTPKKIKRYMFFLQPPQKGNSM